MGCGNILPEYEPVSSHGDPIYINFHQSWKPIHVNLRLKEAALPREPSLSPYEGPQTMSVQLSKCCAAADTYGWKLVILADFTFSEQCADSCMFSAHSEFRTHGISSLHMYPSLNRYPRTSRCGGKERQVGCSDFFELTICNMLYFIGAGHP